MNEFQALGLSEEVLRGVESLGFEKPTPIQEKVIPTLLETETDVVALAQTGTGKTAAFGLPLICGIDISNKKTQALVLSPTRELGLQIANDFANYGKYLDHFKVTAVYGGSSIERQIKDIKRGTHVIVATPGRLCDLIKRGAVSLNTVKCVVLDEADEMLNMGFKDDLDFILEQTPEEKKTWLFSATMPKEVARIAKNYMKDSISVEAGERNTGAKNIDHVYYRVDGRDRYEATKRIVDLNPDIFGVIFCQTKRQTQEVADNLMRDGYNADALHGDLSQLQRDRVMNRFRKRNLQMLVATDVAARGIDVDDITHVINYNIPDDIESYTHRSGRTARAGKKGTSICIITPSEEYKIRQIEKIIKAKFSLKLIPSGIEVIKQQMVALIERVKETNEETEELDNLIPELAEHFEDLDADTIIKKFIALEFNRFLDYYKGSRDINKTKGDRRGDRDDRRGRDRRDGRGRDRDRGGRDRRDRGGKRGKTTDGFTLIFINAGSTDDLNPGQLINWACKNTGISGEQIGAIRIRDKFSFFEVESAVAKKVVAQKGLKMRKRDIRLEISKG